MPGHMHIDTACVEHIQKPCNSPTTRDTTIAMVADGVSPCGCLGAAWFIALMACWIQASPDITARHSGLT